ncbi:hypothetical protein DFH08DRAFT_940505 [Mycena albidolilacea]|uniref:Protein kinase domain-containing protein n=1 Tax=Mycena albidolilacea TaxID=1033008 RepID=A0AAD6ZMJ8_9AGAR|nr:hypothetical protein DFH08DRAFT_940505 [Mycena albidolilacea]
MHDGPNGRHQCIIGEALGPSLASCRLCSFVWDKEVIPADIVCQLVGQITLGVEYLHKRNVVHGDLHQGNTLLCPPTPMATLAAVESHMGKLRKWLVTDMDSDQIPRRSSVTLVRHGFLEAGLWRLQDIVTPKTYRPCTVLPRRCSGSRAAHRPTRIYGLWQCSYTYSSPADVVYFMEDGNRDRLLSQMVLALGRFPEPLWSSWADRNKYFNEQGQPLDPRASSDFLKAPWVFNKEMPEGGHERRMFKNLLRTMVSYYPCATAANVVAICSELPYGLVLGRDWLFFCQETIPHATFALTSGIVCPGKSSSAAVNYLLPGASGPSNMDVDGQFDGDTANT